MPGKHIKKCQIVLSTYCPPSELKKKFRLLSLFRLLQLAVLTINKGDHMLELNLAYKMEEEDEEEMDEEEMN